MRTDKSVGATIFKVIDGVDHVLLVKKVMYDTWEIPKGHPEDRDEDIEDSVRREIKEETGYTQITLNGVADIVTYEAEKNGEVFNKEVTFYMGEHHGEEVPVQELDDDEDEQGMVVGWHPVDGALELIGFPPFIQALESAINIRNYNE